MNAKKAKMIFILGIILLAAVPLSAGGEKKKPTERAMLEKIGSCSLRSQRKRRHRFGYCVGISGHHPRQFRRKALSAVRSGDR